MKIIEAEDLLPEASEWQRAVQRAIDIIEIASMEKMINGKLILTGNGVKHSD